MAKLGGRLAVLAFALALPWLAEAAGYDFLVRRLAKDKAGLHPTGPQGIENLPRIGGNNIEFDAGALLTHGFYDLPHP